MIRLKTFDLGVLSYKEAYALQKRLLEAKKRMRAEDFLLLVEHPDIFTIGRTGSRKNLHVSEALLREKGVEVIDIDRGGDITFHGPGQLVAYPIFDLRNHGRDIRLFIKNLEIVLELTISAYGLKADRQTAYTGLWVGGCKIGFIGVGISGWVTFHGLSLNADMDLGYFSMIRPCGIDGLAVNDLRGILDKDIDFDFLKRTLTEKCCEVFGFERSAVLRPDALMAQEEASRL